MIFVHPEISGVKMGPYLGHEVLWPIFVSKKKQWEVQKHPMDRGIDILKTGFFSYQDSTCLDGTFVACLEMISSAAKIMMKKSYNHQSYHHPWNSKDHFKKCVFHQVDDFFEVGNF